MGSSEFFLPSLLLLSSPFQQLPPTHHLLASSLNASYFRPLSPPPNSSSLSLLPSFKYLLFQHTSKSPSTSILLPSTANAMASMPSENDMGAKPQTRRVCVMDASGHLGTNLFNRLLDMGFAVHAAVHSHGWLLAKFQSSYNLC